MTEAVDVSGNTYVLTEQGEEANLLGFYAEYVFTPAEGSVYCIQPAMVDDVCD